MSHKPTRFAGPMLRLFQGPLYYDDHPYWEILLKEQEHIELAFTEIGLQLHLHEEDGFAYLSQPDWSQEDSNLPTLPRLTRKSPMTFQQTVLCVVLREYLLQFDNQQLEGGVCLIRRDQIHTLMLPFLTDQTNEVSLHKKIDTTINSLVELGFLKSRTQNNESDFEIRRFLKAKLDAETLNQLKERLAHNGTN